MRRGPLMGRSQLKCDGTRAETRFRLSAKRTSPFKSAWGLQSSRLLAAEVCASAVVMLDTPCSEVVWRVLATHSTRTFPLHFHLPCVTVCRHISTGLYAVTSLLLESLKLSRIYVTSFSFFFPNRFILDPFCPNALIILVPFLFRSQNLPDQIPDTNYLYFCHFQFVVQL